MGLYKKKNIALGAFGRLIFPENLWTREFLLAWVGCFLTVIVFDLLWCAQTTFRAFSFAGTYINAFTLSIALSLPTVLSRRIWPQITAMAIVDLLMIAKYFERMGDHAAEIAKWVLFSITGNKEG